LRGAKATTNERVTNCFPEWKANLAFLPPGNDSHHKRIRNLNSNNICT
jgi:hypothetical protein